MFFFSHEVQGDYGNLGILQLSLLYHAVQHSLEQIVDISGPAGTCLLYTSVATDNFLKIRCDARSVQMLHHCRFSRGGSKCYGNTLLF